MLPNLVQTNKQFHEASGYIKQLNLSCGDFDHEIVKYEDNYTIKKSNKKQFTQCLDHLINFIISINYYSKREAVKSDETVFTSAEFFSEKWYSTWIIIMKVIF